MFKGKVQVRSRYFSQAKKYQLPDILYYKNKMNVQDVIVFKTAKYVYVSYMLRLNEFKTQIISNKKMVHE